MLEMYDIVREMKGTMRVQRVIDLFNKGLMPDQIEAETGYDIDEIEDIIECEQNYRRG